mmetsp:Transcript_10173/g.17718  ORF Transcript_10173/g.17718 Transcript_10173/m.17718 type:complete len:92 (+) Transcript_10173:116-391(+)
MVYITRAGTLQEKRTGVLALLLAFLYTFLDVVTIFFSTLVSPDAQVATMKKKQSRSTGYGGGGSGSGRPRITGVDQIQGASGGAAACQTGG